MMLLKREKGVKIKKEINKEQERWREAMVMTKERDRSIYKEGDRDRERKWW